MFQLDHSSIRFTQVFIADPIDSGLRMIFPTRQRCPSGAVFDGAFGDSRQHNDLVANPHNCGIKNTDHFPIALRRFDVARLKQSRVR